MSAIIAIVMFVAGLILVVKGGDWFVDSAAWMARVAGIPTFLIGATIVSIATTLPELIVSVIAAAGGQADMAVGNAVGSVTANTGLILAIGVIFMAKTIDRKRFGLQILLLVLAAATLFIGCLKGELNIIAAVALIVFFILFMIYNVSDAKRNMDAAADDEKESADKKTIAVKILFFVLGTAGIVIGSRLLVNGGTELAKLLGVPERVIAVTLVAIGTSLPELVTTLTAIRKKESALSLGNIVGANLIDLTLILPLCSLVSGKPLPVSASCAMIDIPACLAITVLAFIPMLAIKRTSKAVGILCLAAYVGYLVITI